MSIAIVNNTNSEDIGNMGRGMREMEKKRYVEIVGVHDANLIGGSCVK